MIKNLLSVHKVNLILVFLIVSGAYFRLFGNYFQQDEWHTFGHYIRLSHIHGLELLRTAMPTSLFGHFTPFSLFFKMALYSIFLLNAKAYFFVSILGHVVVSISIYFLIYYFLKNKTASLIGTLFFALNSGHDQAVTWIGAFESVQYSLLFSTVSIVSFEYYLNHNKSKYLLISSLSLLLAFLFKETAAPFYIAIAYLALTKEKKIKKLFSKAKYFLLTLAAYILVRISYVFFAASEASSVSNKPFELKYFFYNLTSLPLKILGRTVVPPQILESLSAKYLSMRPPEFGPWVDRSELVYDAILALAGLAVLCFFVYRSKKSRNKRFVGLGMIISLSVFLPLLPIKGPQIFIDSRHVYPATLGVAILISDSISTINLKVKKTVIFLSLILLVNLISLQNILSKYADDAKTTNTILAAELFGKTVLEYA